MEKAAQKKSEISAKEKPLKEVGLFSGRKQRKQERMETGIKVEKGK